MNRISFFSYKGGSGRSSLAYNTLPYIARNLNASPQRPLIILDMDIDSAGLSLLFDDLVENTDLFVQTVFETSIPGGIIGKDICPDIGDHPFFKNLTGIGEVYGMEKESILFLPARTKGNRSIAADSYTLNGERLDRVVSLCDEYKCCGMIFDCPTGDQMTANASLRLSDKVIVVMRITSQFRYGTYMYLKDFDAKAGTDKQLIIVPNAVPRDKISLNGIPYNYDAVKAEIVENIRENVKRHNISFHMLEDGRFGVPEVVRFKFKEDILFSLKQRTPDEEAALAMYEEVADAICPR